jgi:hypothetical protein
MGRGASRVLRAVEAVANAVEAVDPAGNLVRAPTLHPGDFERLRKASIASKPPNRRPRQSDDSLDIATAQELPRHLLFVFAVGSHILKVLRPPFPREHFRVTLR